jgi:hypothetical protein
MVLLKKIIMVTLVFFSISVCLHAQSGASPTITRDKNGKPNWVDRPESAFNKAFYATAVGYGATRSRADASAFAALTGLFGQSVTSRMSDIAAYKQQVVNGSKQIVSSQEAMQAIEVSSSMDSLIGAEINDRWEDKARNTFYAVAVLEKRAGIKLYSDLLNGNLLYIDRLLAMSNDEKASFEGAARYRLAGSIADADEIFATVVSVLGGPDRRGTLKSGDEYRYEAGLLNGRIAVNVVVQNDSANRVKAAFAGVFADAGFRTGNSNSRYVLNVRVSLSPVVYNDPALQFTRYVVDANLTDTKTGSVLLPFNINDREGHTTRELADAKALTAIEAAIKEKYSAHFSDFCNSY